jgi:hypothetical protein
MASPARFRIEMIGRAEEVEKSVNRIVELAGRAIAKEVIATTPVDTSQALSNWTGSLGSPSTVTRLPYSPGHFGDTAGTSGAAAQVAVNAAIKGRRTGQDVWISNSLPYINDLNVGNIKPRTPRPPDRTPPDRTPYPRFAERALQFGTLEVIKNARKIFK